MLRRYASVFVILAVAAAVVLTGCGRSGGGSSSSIAEINGKKITSNDLVNYMSRNPMTKEQVSAALSQMLDEELVLSLAAEKKVTPTDEQVNARLAPIKKAEDLDAYLKESGLTLDEYKHRLMIEQARINLAETTLKTKIKDEDVKKEYDQRKNTAFSIPERVKMEAVIFPNKAAADSAVKKLSSGSSIQQVADEAGLKVEHQAIPKQGTGLPEQITKPLFSTPKGKPTKPISLGGMTGSEQWLVMVPGDKMPAVKITLEEAKPLIYAQLVMKSAIASGDYNKMLENARKDAKLTISEPGLKDVEKTFKKTSPSGAALP
ncbi:MAG: peptidyl-prolyl cis-trans isomerase [Armatimonadota bacterium]